MQIRAETKPTIAKMNRCLAKLLAARVNSYQENVRIRGDWSKMMARRPKRK